MSFEEWIEQYFRNRDSRAITEEHLRAAFEAGKKAAFGTPTIPEINGTRVCVW